MPRSSATDDRHEKGPEARRAGERKRLDPINRSANGHAFSAMLVVTGRRPGWGTIPRGAAFAETQETEAPAPLPR
jgi:hypothetical protein